jgi:hypothetical protein
MEPLVPETVQTLVVALVKGDWLIATHHRWRSQCGIRTVKFLVLVR